MPLSTAERERVSYHLGYLQVAPAASIQLGIPRPIQTVFLLESAMNNLLEAAIPRVRRILAVMDAIEEKLCEALDRLAAKQLNGITLRDDEHDKLEREYQRWGHRLADLLGVPLYPYSTRYQKQIGAGNVRVKG